MNYKDQIVSCCYGISLGDRQATNRLKTTKPTAKSIRTPDWVVTELPRSSPLLFAFPECHELSQSRHFVGVDIVHGGPYNWQLQRRESKAKEEEKRKTSKLFTDGLIASYGSHDYLTYRIRKVQVPIA
jgi:hypothetical protein